MTTRANQSQQSAASLQPMSTIGVLGVTVSAVTRPYPTQQTNNVKPPEMPQASDTSVQSNSESNNKTSK